jgi:oligopeptide transport system substrate-binding protein
MPWRTPAAAALLALATACSSRVEAPPGVLRLLISSEPPQLDSTKATDQVSGFVLGHIMEGLTRYGVNGEIIPGVADRWEIRDDGATFHLRDGAQWADGQPVTAKDFVFAWRTVVDPATASEYAFIMYPLKNAEAINKGKLPTSALGVRASGDRTLEITFEQPCGYFLGLTAFPTFFPLREDFYQPRRERYAADVRDLLTNGPFTLTRWVHAASLRMEKNPRYWDAARIRLEVIDIPFITADPNAPFNLFKDGKIDTLGLGRRELLARAEVERFRMKIFMDGSVFYTEFNFRPGRPTANFHLRKALQLVFNPSEYVSRVIGIPGTKPAISYIPAWVPGVDGPFRKEHPLEPVRPDLEEARRHLEIARQELGGTIRPLFWLADDSPNGARDAEYFQYLLKTRLGLDLRIDKQTFKQRLAKMSAGDFDLVAAGWGPDYADAMTFADLLASWNENNRGRYANPRYDELIRKAQATADPRARLDAMAAAERIALDEVALLPTIERANVYVHSPRVNGIVRHVVGPDPDYTFATVGEPPAATARQE